MTTTPHDTALEAFWSERNLRRANGEEESTSACLARAITAYLAALPVDEEALASSIYAVLAKDWYNRKLGVLPVTGQQCLMAVQTLRPYLRTPQPSLTETQPMSEEDRAALVEDVSVSIAEAMHLTPNGTTWEDASDIYATAALAHIEANYHLVKKDK